MGSLGLSLADKEEGYHNQPLCQRLERFSHRLLRDTRSHRMAGQGALEAWSTVRTSSRLAFPQMRVHGELILVQVDHDLHTNRLDIFTCICGYVTVS